ncbi:hypothetical protein Shewmr4_3436 [Shewanella sp. MR-4]|uniref:Methyl-accepting chemotaxis sensory transducer n=1 Tax=Shewanella sp. (strain MR-7) TaxID=60481 RepID=Q0HZD7_SHESR|nr:hypothetical protein Shewmr4_3436 [Shewanella sp. MR-4]
MRLKTIFPNATSMQTARAGDELAQLSMRLTTLLSQFKI